MVPLPITARRPLAFATHVAMLVLLALLCAGCKPPPLSLDLPRINAEVERRAATAVARPDVNKDFDALFNEVFADPSVGEAGTGLMTAFGADATLKPGFDAVIEKFGSQPAMKQLIAKLMRENPRATAEQIGELTGERVTKLTDGPVFDHAFDQASKDLFARSEVDAELQRFGEKAANNDAVSTAINEAVEKHVSDEQWRLRLTALNGGKAPDQARATDLLIEHAFSEARFAAFYHEMIALPVMKRELTAALRALAASPTFERYAKDAVRACADDPTFRDRAVDALSLVISDAVTEETLAAAMKRVLDTPVVTTALVTMLQRMNKDPELGAIGAAALSKISADPAFRALLGKLYEGW